MTLMNPKWRRHTSTKNLITCQVCGIVFEVDGRGVRKYCKNCRRLKRNEHYRNKLKEKKQLCQKT